MTNFRELLSQPTDNFAPPPVLPAGHYHGIIKDHEFSISKIKKTNFVRFLLTPQEAADDIDIEAVQGINLSKKILRKDFYITPDSLYRLTNFLDAVLGKQPGRAFDDRIPETLGARVTIAVSQRADENDSETIYNDVGTVVAYGG